MAKIRVMIVDDSLFIRKSLRKILESDGTFEVISEASSVQDAITEFNRSEPDLIITDIQLLDSNGIELIRWVMRVKPKPILVLSGEIDETNSLYYEAVELGIISFIKKDPSRIAGILDLKTTLLNSIQAKVKKQPVPPPIAESNLIMPAGTPSGRQLILIGASTGGPQAIEMILRELPAGFPHSICIVQHMPEGFTGSFARRLDSLAALPVEHPEFLTELKPGKAYVGKAGYHMNLSSRGNSLWISLNEDPADALHKPSVDELFISASKIKSITVHAFLLTGMGSDGARGLVTLRLCGHKTFTQASGECVVDGMPRIGRELGGAIREMKLLEIARYLTNLK